MAKQKLTAEQHAKFSRVGKSNVRNSKVHERRVANLLTEWSSVQFRRRRVEGKDIAVRAIELTADVIPCAGDFIYSIECKKGKDFSLDGLMANPTGSVFTTWWHQTCYDAQLLSSDLNRNIYPMMFFKPHPNWDWVAISSRSAQLLTAADSVPAPWSTIWFPHIYFEAYKWLGPIEGNVSHSDKNPKLVSINLDPVIICRWRDFAKNVCPKSAFYNYPDNVEQDNGL